MSQPPAFEPHDLYTTRFRDVDQTTRIAMWEVLCRVVLQRYVGEADVVVDLGAGRCEFINAIRCREKVAVDTDAVLRNHAAPGVRVLAGEIPAVLGQLASASIHVVFCSNFLEHLADKGAVLEVLREVHRLLVPGGRLILLQPNIRYAYREYWDFFDHHVPMSDRSLGEALHLAGFAVEAVRPRFLPFTTTSRLPKAAWLVRVYLALRPLQWLFGKQMLVISRKP